MLMQADQSEATKQPNQPEPLIHRRADLVRQYATAHLAHTVTFTDLERAASLFSYALQCAFLKRFDCAPTKWVCNQRFAKVQQHLASADLDINATNAAFTFVIFLSFKICFELCQRL